jgi:serine/threonine protein kinase
MSGPAENDRIPESVSPFLLPDFEYDDLEKGKRIGTGGDADVYRATIDHNGYTYPVAIKEPRFKGTIQERVIEKFETEAETWSSLNENDNIVSVYGWGSEPPWLVLEFIDGGTLDAQIGSFGVAEALWLSGRIADGIYYGHRHGVAHLDIKPTNVLLRDTPDGKWKYPKVSDWGLAKMLLEHSSSIEGISPTYAAPEQFDAEKYGDPNDITDIYQLGALVYALLAGEPPFSGSSTAVMQGVLQEKPDPPSAVSSEVPAAVDEVVLKALAKEKDNRYESVVLFRKELDRLFDEYSLDSENPTTTGEVSSERKPTDQMSQNTTDSGSGTTAAHEAGTVNHKLQIPSSLGESQGRTVSSGSVTRGGTGDDSSLLSRRSALGLLGAGALGGGGLLVTQMRNGDESASTAPSGTDTGTTQSDTPTEAPPSEGTSTSEYSLETYEDFEEGLDNLDQEDISYFQGALDADPGYVQDVEIGSEYIFFDSVALEYDRMSQDMEQYLNRAEETGNIESWLERYERNLDGTG